jgi:hypothetical protein
VMDVNPNDPQNDSFVHILLALLITIGTFVVNLYRRKATLTEGCLRARKPLC